jgi:hypothetical protein
MIRRSRSMMCDACPLGRRALLYQSDVPAAVAQVYWPVRRVIYSRAITALAPPSASMARGAARVTVTFLSKPVNSNGAS